MKILIYLNLILYTSYSFNEKVGNPANDFYASKDSGEPSQVS